ncbi:putative LPLAT superfamily acyltransferase [Mesonia hippocampi]|uniref:Putative LPLAT superfamily acyltransferase n=1 Tax=Mesonia hippocampi TaxID=1628250 RepID=A0A840EHS4_9FLAO|nr:lipid A biosynthesis acyltransferase [Mesonia hippocampi]MBB4117969.1 putative LPLAT superfamily acyltransferase [Mesonia hippocampi]
MSQWDGRSGGSLLGYRIFVFFIKKAGVKTAYFILYFVAFYYLLTAWQSNKAIYTYLYKHLKYSSFKAGVLVYQSYLIFGKVLIDKVAINSGLRNKFTYEFDGIENLQKLLADKKGGILISAHIGNFEVAEKFFAEIDFDMQINLVTTDLERNEIKEYLESISEKSSIKYIIVKDDMSHIFDINAALANNELICFTGDRYFEGGKTFEATFLGEKAKFPTGPFLLASRLKVPVVFVYVMKEKNLHYHLYARKAEVKHRDAQALLENYVADVETMLHKYPLQWFNYFDFWKK